MSIQTFFLGGSSPTGFRSPFGAQLADTDFYTYIIKGGPGTGKSSLMKRIAEAFPEEETELYLCSSDPSSADAVILKNRKVIFVDGTAPHVFDPEYPGAAQEIINLGEFWDGEFLRSKKDEIIAVTSDYLQCHARCRRCISAAGSVLTDAANIASTALDTQKLDRFASRFARKILPHKGFSGGVVYKQRSAITPLGYKTFISDNDSIFLLSDNIFAAGDYFLKKLSEKAVDAGYKVEISVCYACESGFYEHIRLPELEISFITANGINGLDSEKNVTKINFNRFYSKEILTLKKQRLKFSCGAAEDLLDEAVKSLALAKSYHDSLESYYVKAVNFKAVTAFGDKLIKKLK